jgi:signal transduction histidine kinase/ligand-binding sensor domain-containing protein
MALTLASSGCAFALNPTRDVSQYAHSAWLSRDGFPKGIVEAIAQTPDGYLWMGTEFGLLRFDGVRAIQWQPPASQHLPGTEIRSLMVARDGTLWIGTDKGLASWKDGRLTAYPESAGQISALLEDRAGTVWAGAWSPSASRLCSIRDGGIQCYGADGSFGYAVFSLYEDSRGTLWVGSGTGVWRWRPGPPKLYPLPERPNGLLEGDNGALLIATSDGIRQLIDGKVKAYPIPGLGQQFFATRLLRGRNGDLWVGTNRGLLHVHQGRTDGFARSDGLSGDYVVRLFEDREGNIWSATYSGLDRFREFAVSTISVDQGLSNSAAGAALATRDGSIWIGTNDGLNRWNHGQITIYRKGRTKGADDAEQKRQLSQSGAANARVREITDPRLPDSSVESLGQDDRGRIWVSTRGGVAYLENGRFISVAGAPAELVHSIAGDNAGNVWIADQDQGLLHLLGGSVVEQIPWVRLGRKDYASALLADPLHGGLWLGFFQGGLVYFKDGQVRASYAGAQGLGEGRVNDLEADRDGALWAATDGGLSRVTDGHIATLTSSNGLPCNAVHWMMEDDAHSVWLETACGLVRIARPELDAWAADPKRTIQATVFDYSDGVRSHSFASGYSPRVAKSTDGKLWFPTFDGVSIIDPSHLALNQLPPPVEIEQVTADGKTFWQDLSGDASSSHPRPPPLVHDVTIDYTALSLVAPDKVLFRYKLEGVDRDWQDVGNRRQAFYTNLAPGKYRFRVIACNNSGVWNEQGASLDFTIAPAYYQTNWFRTLCALTFLAMLWTVYQLRVRAFERRQEILEKHQTEIRALNEQMIEAQEAERMRIAGDLHDGVLQQITSLVLRLGKVRRQVPPDSEATATVSGLQQQLIQIGTDIRNISHELHPALLQEAGLPAALSSYCEEFSKVRGIPVSCESDENVKELSPGSALCLYRIAQEALGNAAKHSRAKKVEVRLSRCDGRVSLSVSDDGVGCDPGQIGKLGGLGVISMRERVLQLDGTFEFESELGRGTRMKVTVPFRPAS